jgi:hypothetical protein
MKRFATALLVSSLLVPSLNSAETLGRLFFTPAQRNTLDAGKQLDRPKSAGPTVRGPRSLTVNGIVTRSDGESTVWVNGGAAGVKRRGAATISATPSNAATARVQVTGTSTKLRVGQTLDRATGRITESYESRPAATRGPPERSAKPDASQDVTADGGEPDQSSNAVEPDNGRTAP